MSSILSHLIRRLVVRAARRNGRMSLRELRSSMENIAGLAHMPRSVAVEPVVIGGTRGEWLVPKRAASRRAFLYLHGGAFCSGSPLTHRHLAGRIAHHAQAAVLVPDYRLVPEYVFPAALDDCVAGYHELMRRGFSPDRIAIAGDSAGGNLALATLLRLRDSGEPLPGCAVCLSPVTDLARSDEETKRRDNETNDPVIRRSFITSMVARYAGSHDPAEPLLSPLFGDLRGLPPILLQAGGEELLRADSELFVERARRDGVEASLSVYPGMWHVWQILVPYLAEARRAVREVVAFACAHTAARGVVEQTLW